MAVTHEAVTWAYRLILGREPESDTVVRQAMHETSTETLRATFLTSAEFRNSAEGQRSGLDVGRHQDVTDIPVQTSCTDVEMSRMLSNIAREWRKFGETAPHWSVVTSEAFSVENIEHNLEHFYSLGQDHLKTMLNPLLRAGVGKRRFRKALDFGCGVGRLTLPLAGVANQVMGVDISPPHLSLARQRADQTGVVTDEILIHAPATVIWQNIERVPAIAPAELAPNWTHRIGFPRPVEATLSYEGVGGIRHASFERGLMFIETVTVWEPRHRLAFGIRADSASIPTTTLDEHVTIGGRYFDVLAGEYSLEPVANGDTLLHLVSHQRLSTDFNFYAGLWTDAVMQNLQTSILQVIQHRCQTQPQKRSDHWPLKTLSSPLTVNPKAQPQQTKGDKS